jgi:hypothetical protein
MNGYVPLSIRQSRATTWLWRHSKPDGWLHYDRARRLARLLP